MGRCRAIGCALALTGSALTIWSGITGVTATGPLPRVGNSGDVWVAEHNDFDKGGHGMSPHIDCSLLDDLAGSTTFMDVWGAKLASSSGTFSIIEWSPTGDGTTVDYGPAPWSYAGPGSERIAVVDLGLLIGNAVRNGDIPHPKQGFHFKLIVEPGGKQKVFWVNCDGPSQSTTTTTASSGSTSSGSASTYSGSTSSQSGTASTVTTSGATSVEGGSTAGSSSAGTSTASTTTTTAASSSTSTSGSNQSTTRRSTTTAASPATTTAESTATTTDQQTISAGSSSGSGAGTWTTTGATSGTGAGATSSIVGGAISSGGAGAASASGTATSTGGGLGSVFGPGLDAAAAPGGAAATPGSGPGYAGGATPGTSGGAPVSRNGGAGPSAALVSGQPSTGADVPFAAGLGMLLLGLVLVGLSARSRQPQATQ